MSIPVQHFQPDNQRCNESWIAPKCCTHCNTSAYIHLMLCGITNNTVESSSHHIPLAILNLLPTQLNHLHAVLLHLIRLAAGRCCTCRRLRISFLQQWHDQLRQQRGLLAQELHISADRRGMNGVVQHLSLLQIQFHRLHQLLMQQTNIQYIPIGVGPVLDRRLLLGRRRRLRRRRRLLGTYRRSRPQQGLDRNRRRIMHHKQILIHQCQLRHTILMHIMVFWNQFVALNHEQGTYTEMLSNLCTGEMRMQWKLMHLMSQCQHRFNRWPQRCTRHRGLTLCAIQGHRAPCSSIGRGRWL